MKHGRSLQELAAELDRQRQSKRDMIAPSSLLMFKPDGSDVRLHVGDDQSYDVSEIAHDQIATYLDIPRKYYDRMRGEQPALLSHNVNTWMAGEGERRMVRTLDGTCRALLSDKYRRLENWDLAEAVLPTLIEGKMEIVSCEITERRFYLKAVDHRVNLDIPNGKRMGDGSSVMFDTCVPALSISNSEVGFGRLAIESGMLTKGCTNLCFFSQEGLKRRHVGQRFEGLDDVTDITALLSEDTQRVSDAALWMQVRDVVRASFNELHFRERVAKVTATVEQRIEPAKVVEVVDFTAKRFGLTDGEKGGVLAHLMEGGSLSQYGLFNAVTRTAEDVASYDRAYELEKMGGRIVDLGPSEWKVIANTVGDPLKLAA